MNRPLTDATSNAQQPDTTFDDWWNATGADAFGLEGFYAAREAWQFALKEGKRRASIPSATEQITQAAGESADAIAPRSQRGNGMATEVATASGMESSREGGRPSPHSFSDKSNALPYGWAMPQSVEELIDRLNTNGGTCYKEHADLIRAFFARSSIGSIPRYYIAVTSDPEMKFEYPVVEGTGFVKSPDGAWMRTHDVMKATPSARGLIDHEALRLATIYRGAKHSDTFAAHNDAIVLGKALIALVDAGFVTVDTGETS